MTYTYIFGMAKSSFNLKGAKRQKLELDVLRLIYVINSFKRKKDKTAIGYVVVYNDEIRETIYSWLKKYNADNLNIEIFAFEASKKEETDLISLEKQSNKIGITKSSKKDSFGNLSMDITETYLADKIHKKYPKAIKVEEIDFFELLGKFPYTIKWDYYGVINEKL
jgi:hypothetical protein